MHLYETKTRLGELATEQINCQEEAVKCAKAVSQVKQKQLVSLETVEADAH